MLTFSFQSFDPFFRDAKSKAKTQWESAAQEFKKIIIQGHLRLMNSEMKAGWDALGSDKRNEWDKKAENLKASEEFDLSVRLLHIFDYHRLKTVK
jgi:hypothetical protein